MSDSDLNPEDKLIQKNDEESENKLAKTDSQEIANTSSEELGEVLENLPPEIKKMMRMAVSMERISGVSSLSIGGKINEEHISKIIEYSARSEERVFKDAESSRKYVLFYGIIIAFTMLALTLLLINKGDKGIDAYTKLIQLILSFISLFIGGLGLGKLLDKRNN